MSTPEEKVAIAQTSSPAARRLDPDPVSIILAALGALGSVASLAAYLGHHRDKARQRTKARRTILRSLASLREAVSEIERSLDELERLLGQYDRSKVSTRSVLKAPADFGGTPPLFDFFEFSVYQMIAQRVTSAFDRCVADTHEIMDGIEDGSLDVPADLFSELGELQSRLNTLRYERRSISEILSGIRHVAQKMLVIVEDLERYIVFDRAS